MDKSKCISKHKIDEKGNCKLRDEFTISNKTDKNFNKTSDEAKRTESPSKVILSAKKFLKLIDQSDISWFAEINVPRLRGGHENTEKNGENTTETLNNCVKEKPKNILSYALIACPISNCEIHFLPNDMIMHYLSFHERTLIQKAFENQRLLLTVAPFELTLKETTCLGLICYGGGNGGNGEDLVKRNMCVEQNLLLHREFDYLKCDYPIFVLASVISMEIFSEAQELKRKNFPAMLIIWLVGSSIDISLTCTITTYDENRLYSRSNIIGLLPIMDKQDPQDVCTTNKYFCIHFKELSTFVSKDMKIELELIFHEI